jgi:uncharacterized protein (DUF1015 family)
MAIIHPFAAVRPACSYAENVISLPYDVMNRAEATEMAAGNPYSFLHICRSEIDLPDVADPYDPSVYIKAKETLSEFLDKGILVRDDKPMLYIYAQVMHGRIQTGIVACTAIDDYLSNTIKKHEYTRYEKELDRINHFDTCNANTEPVFLTYREQPEIRFILDGWISKNRPEYDITTQDGIQHIFWVVNDDFVINKLVALFSAIDSLYIADGHHRSASAVKVGQKRRSDSLDYSGTEEFNYFMAVLFPDIDLHIFDYNRVVKDLNGLSIEAFIAAVSQFFDIEQPDAGPYSPERLHTFGMYLDGCWYKLTAKALILDSADLIKSLDVSILQDHLLGPVLGIEDPRKDKRIDFIGGIRGLKELERRVNEDMTVGFALYPVTIEELLAVSDNDMVMPPKSTWFEPKLGSGLFIHEL